MLLVGTVLLAWAVALRVASNALFAALACWMSLWVFIWSRVLQLLGTPWTASLAVSVSVYVCGGASCSHTHSLLYPPTNEQQQQQVVRQPAASVTPSQ